MKKLLLLAMVLGLFVSGCATTNNFETIKANLDSCLGKLTKDQLIMRASTPTERVEASNGEIWIYKYRKSDILTTTTGTGGLLFPFQSESKSYDHAFDVRLGFDRNGMLNDWSFSGHYDYFDHPFKTLRCQ